MASLQRFTSGKSARATPCRQRRADAAGRFARKIVAEARAAGPFWMAEDDHQQYLEKRGLAVCNTP